MKPMPIMLFAAGLGTRMKPLTDTQPKPLIRVAGRALIDHALALTEAAPVGSRVVNLHHKATMITAHLGNRNILISDETGTLLETGGGLRKAMPLLGSSPVMTLNTDAVWDGPNPLSLLQNAWREDMDALLLTVPIARAAGHRGAGDFASDESGRLTRGGGEVYTGLQIIRTDALDDIDQSAFSLNLLWDKFAKRGTLYGTSYAGRWCDVGQPDSIPVAERMLGYTNV